MTDTSPAPTLIDGNICLRRARDSDLDARMAAGNSPRIQHMYGVAPEMCEPISRKQAQGWIAYHLRLKNAWFIDIEGELGGDICLHSVSMTDRRATLAMGLLHDKHLGMGYGTRALNLVIAYAFGTLKLHRIALRVLDYNARALSAYKKVGFREEGRERESALVGQTWHDDIMVGLLAHEYLSPAQEAGT